MKRAGAYKTKRVRTSKQSDLVHRYTFEIEWDSGQNCNRARCVMLPSLQAYGRTPEAALKRIISAAARELRSKEDSGEHVPLPIYQQVGGY